MSATKSDLPTMVKPEDPGQVVLLNPSLVPPDGRRFWTDETMDDKPRFAVQEVAKMFFAKTPDWLRWRSDPVPLPKQTREDMSHPNGWFLLDGKRLEAKRTPTGARVYTLHDIEKMAHALAQNGGIDGRTLARIITLVKTEAELYGYL